MKLLNKGLLAVSLAVLGISWFGSAQAVPAFASKYEKNCSYCHTAWPQLNAKGRKFKELGYRFKEDLKDESKDTPYMEEFPIGAILVSRPYDKASNGSREMHGLHEAELFIAGAINKKLSTFVEMETEDENDWNVEFGHAILNYRHTDAINVQLSWAPMFFADPYGTIVDHFSPTVAHYALVSGEGATVVGADYGASVFGGADGYSNEAGDFMSGALGDMRQNVVVNGRVDKIFYAVGISGTAMNPVGGNNNIVNGRVAYDITENMMVGALMVSGKSHVDAAAEDLSFTRTGVDFSGDFGNSRLQVGYITAKDDQVGGGSTKDHVMSIQAIHTYKTEKGKPTWVPVVRYENYTLNDGDYKFADAIVGVSYYLEENVKVMAEYKKDLSAPSKVVDPDTGFDVAIDKENRITMQIMVGF